MKLFINDKTNSAKELYYQSLVLLFLPCEKFGENDDENKLYINAYQADGFNFAHVKLVVKGKSTEFSQSEEIDDSKYAQMKNLIGRTLLKAAFDLFGFLPPWGISTGVKPVKLADMFVSSVGQDKAYKILCDDYMISPQKAKMAIEACSYEKQLMASVGENPCSLYVSIPFCPTKCNYCSFVSCTTPRLLSLIPDYLSALKSELVTISEVVKSQGLNLKSIYIGGGTPAILSETEIDYLLDSIFSCFKFDENCEFTFEAGRPDCITYEKLKVLSNYKVPRISINTQTTDDAILRNIGRNHTYSQFLNAFEIAKKLDFKCINTDLIAGLPGETYESFVKSVKDVEALSPENITVHAFTLKKSSNYRVSGETEFDDNGKDAVRMTDFASEYLSNCKYRPYYVYRQKNTAGNLENVGYSKEGFEGIYNIIMMGEYHTVFGAGAGSVTKIVTKNGSRIDRIFSPKYPYEFLDSTKYKGFDAESAVKLLEKR